MIDFIKNLYRRYKYKVTMVRLRNNLLFFGCDVSHLSDEQIEDALISASEIIVSFGISSKEAICNIQQAFNVGIDYND